MVIDAEFGREYHDLIPCNYDGRGWKQKKIKMLLNYFTMIPHLA
jgi:hypothetical protein